MNEITIDRSGRSRYFRVLRAELGARQRAIADYLGVSPSTISRWERGISPIPDDAIAEVERIRGTLPELTERERIAVIVAVQQELMGGPSLTTRMDPTVAPDERAKIETVLGEILSQLDAIAGDSELARDEIADCRSQVDTLAARCRLTRFRVRPCGRR